MSIGDECAGAAGGGTAPPAGGAAPPPPAAGAAVPPAPPARGSASGKLAQPAPAGLGCGRFSGYAPVFASEGHQASWEPSTQDTQKRAYTAQESCSPNRHEPGATGAGGAAQQPARC